MMMKVDETKKHMGFLIVVKIEAHPFFVMGLCLLVIKRTIVLIEKREREREKERACLSL